MAQDDPIVINDDQKSNPTTFITSGKGEASGVDSTYNDFFQETSDGNISMGPKAQKSGLEITTNILGYIVPLAIVLAVLGSLHVYILKGGGATAIKENYTFLCPYLNFSLYNLSEDYKCDTLAFIESSYQGKLTQLQNNIIARLNEYIPIKLTKNILLTSPERKFAIETYENKIKMDEIMKEFDEVIESSRSLEVVDNNILCEGISIKGDGRLSTQCTIFGNTSGSDDANGKLGSSRIEALRFIGNLSDTSKSQFILLNPPSALSSERVTEVDSAYKTRTTISIEAVYVPFTTNSQS